MRIKNLPEVAGLKLEEILKVQPEKYAICVCLASLYAEGEIPTFERLQLSDELSHEFRGVVRDTLAKVKKSADANDCELRPYAGDAHPADHEIEYLDLSEHDFIQQQIASLAPLNSLAVCEVDDSFMSSLRFYVIAIGIDRHEPIYFFRTYSKQKELGRSRQFAALLRGGQFDRVSSPLFLFDHYLDCFSQGGHMFVLKRGNFRKIFRFFEMVLAAAEETLQTIRGKVPIVNFAEFEGACKGHLQMMAKLKNISQKDYLSMVTLDDLKKVIDHCGLKVEIRMQDGHEQIVFDASNKWELLRLLDDDYLQSIMTGYTYEVSGKRVHE